VYCGLPAANNAFRLVQDVLTSRGKNPSE